MFVFLLLSFWLALVNGQQHEIRIVNNCDFDLNIGIRGENYTPLNGGFPLKSKKHKSVMVPHGWLSGRIWGRTGCGADNCCETGDCGNCQLECGGLTGKSDATLAGFNLDQFNGNDFYFIDLTEGYNLPIKIKPISGTFRKSSFASRKYDCTAPICKHHILDDCPKILREIKNERTIACLSACSRFRTDEYCCPSGSAFGSEKSCNAGSYAHFFKSKCPNGISYAFDEEESTYVCRSAQGKATGYKVMFCP